MNASKMVTTMSFLSGQDHQNLLDEVRSIRQLSAYILHSAHFAAFTQSSTLPRK